jgi:ribosomal protein L30/L7E
MSRLIIHMGLLVAILISCVACATWDDHQRLKVAKQVQANINQKAFTVRDQKTSDLISELMDDSKNGVEPFNSSAYRSIQEKPREKGKNVALSNELVISFSQSPPDRRSFLGLLALRKINESVYRGLTPQFRVKVLTDALDQSQRFNAWGLPHINWEEASIALIGEGEAALPSLITLLDHTRPAPVGGSEMFLEFERYQYRVCDYALGLISEINSRNSVTPVVEINKNIPVDPKKRDQLIRELQEKFQPSDDKKSLGSSLGSPR